MADCRLSSAAILLLMALFATIIVVIVFATTEDFDSLSNGTRARLVIFAILFLVNIRLLFNYCRLFEDERAQVQHPQRAEEGDIFTIAPVDPIRQTGPNFSDITCTPDSQHVDVLTWIVIGIDEPTAESPPPSTDLPPAYEDAVQTSTTGNVHKF